MGVVVHLMLGPLLLTVEIAVLASLLAGLSALAVVVATHGRKFARVIDVVLTAPLVLPPTVLGYYVLLSLGRHSALGGAFESLVGHQLVFTRTAAVLAATLTAFPMILQGLRSSVDSVDPLLLDAARTLGATRVQALWRVAVPLASRGIAAGVVLGFARACGDFGVTLMIAGNLPGETQTASLALYDAVLSGQQALATQLALSLTALALVAIAVVQWLGRRGHE